MTKLSRVVQRSPIREIIFALGALTSAACLTEAVILVLAKQPPIQFMAMFVGGLASGYNVIIVGRALRAKRY